MDWRMRTQKEIVKTLKDVENLLIVPLNQNMLARISQSAK